MRSASARQLNADDDGYRAAPAPRAAGSYDPHNEQQLKSLLATIYADLSAVSNQADVLAFYAGFAYEVALFVREHGNFDLANADPENGDVTAQQLQSALPALEVWIEGYFNSLTPEARLAPADAQEKMQRLVTQARMRAACVWKGFIRALRTPPAEWDVDAVCALGALAVLSMANPAKVVGAQRSPGKADFIRDNARDGDWPPRAPVELCLRHRDVLADKLQALQTRN